MTKDVAVIGIGAVFGILAGAVYWMVRTPKPREYSKNPAEFDDSYGQSSGLDDR
jgi:hypothetical protein